MSGAEAGFVVGLISGIISIIEAARTVYDAAADAKGQPEEFRQVAARLPLVIEILRNAKATAPELDETKREAIEPTLKSCKTKAEKLQEIFQKVVRKDEDKWFDRYKKALRILGKGDKVECLMEGILKDTQLLACDKLMGIATEAQMKELEEGIKEIREMSSSLQDDTESVAQNHHGSGNNNANTGPGAMHTGTGNLYNNKIEGDAHFGSNSINPTFNNYILPMNYISNEKKAGLFRIQDLSNSFFVGREKELAEIRKYLTANNSEFQRRTILWGVGGAGKTQLALTYALKYEKDFQGVFQINAKDSSSARDDYSAIARHLKLPEAVTIDTDKVESLAAQLAAIEAVKNWFVDHEEGNWLLIIDNADSLNGVNLEDYIPATRKGHVIITSQDRQAAGLGPAIEISEMRKHDAEQLFLNKARITHPTAEQMATCTDIVTKLGQLALAVEHAGAYVHNHDLRLRLSEYLKRFVQKQREVMEEAPRYSLHKRSMMATYLLASDAIINRNIKAAYLLTLLGALDGKAVHESVLLSNFTGKVLRGCKMDYSDDYDAAKAVLLSFSLIRLHTDDDGTQVISMHGLVHQCVQAKLPQDWQWQWLITSTSIIVEATSTGAFNQSLVPHLHHVLRRVAERSDQVNCGSPPIWLCTTLVWLISSHHILWWNIGMVDEFCKYLKLAIDALGDEKGDHERYMLGTAVSLYSQSIELFSNKDSPVVLLERFLKQQMTPWAATFIERIKYGAESHSAFKPTSLVQVFIPHTNDGFAGILYTCCEAVGKLYLAQNQVELSSLYFRLQKLPLTSTWILRMTNLLLTILSSPLRRLVPGLPSSKPSMSLNLIAAYDHCQGDLDSTLALLSQIIIRENPGSSHFVAAVYDYSKLLLKLGRISEAAQATDKLLYPQEGMSEADISRQYRDFYIWARKARVMVLKQDHDTHRTAGEVLVQTYNTSKAVYGTNTISTMHAGFLLQQYYSTDCCYNASATSSYSEEITGIFATLYGTPEKLRQELGLRMAQRLLATGQLEEAVAVLQLCVEHATIELGDTVNLTRKAKRLLSVARKEREEEVKCDKEGKIEIRWGSMILRRDVSIPNVDVD